MFTRRCSSVKPLNILQSRNVSAGAPCRDRRPSLGRRTPRPAARAVQTSAAGRQMCPSQWSPLSCRRPLGASNSIRRPPRSTWGTRAPGFSRCRGKIRRRAAPRAWSRGVTQVFGEISVLVGTASRHGFSSSHRHRQHWTLF